MKQPLGIILAGGLARRMGGEDKALLSLGGTSLLAHVAQRFRPQVAELALNANGNSARFSKFDLPVLPDTIEGFPGPLAGILAGLEWAAEKGAEMVVSVAVDTPFFPGDLAPHLLLATEGMKHPLALATSDDGRHPTFGLWPVALRNDLREAIEGGLRKVVEWTDAHGAVEAHFPGLNPDPFFNINKPEDLKHAQLIQKAAH